MSYKEKDKTDRNYPPANVSANYYTDPIYTTGSYFGFEEADDKNSAADFQNSADDDDSAADESVESWGWINNVDDKKYS